MDVAKLPKIELHLHLEGAAPPGLINSMAKEKNLNISEIFNAKGNYKFKNFSEFLVVYEKATSVLQTPQDFYDLTMGVLKQCADNNVVYVETFLSPQFCGSNDIGAWKEFLAAIRSASADSENQFGIVSRGIVTIIRHLGPEVAKASAKCAEATADDWLVGLGMAGDETVGKQKDFMESFEMARGAGLKLTSHAGEWCGSDAVADAVIDLGVQRIGHGAQAIKDPKVIELLMDREIVLEMCPGSNVFLSVYPNLGAHPIKKLKDMGVKVTVSTDDPPFFNTSMNQEYGNLAKVFDWTKEDFIELNKVALDAAFCDTKTKNMIFQKLQS